MRIPVLSELARLIVPVSCPGCGELDVPWCVDCTAPFQPSAIRLKRVEERVPRLDRIDGRGPLPVWAICDYSGPVRSLIVHWKDGGRADLDKLFRPAMASAAASLAEETEPRRILIVPAPSHPGAQRARGRAHLDPIAAAAVSGLHASGWSDASLVRALAKPRAGRDQVGLGARARGANNPVVVRQQALNRARPGALALLVDDVVTTGATLASAELALTRAHLPVLGALVLAATVPPGGARVAN